MRPFCKKIPGRYMCPFQKVPGKKKLGKLGTPKARYLTGF